MNDIFNDFNRLKEEISFIKEKFEAHITDQSIPLDKRWEMFCAAPEELKNDLSYLDLEATKVFEAKGLLEYDEPPFFPEKYRRYDTACMLSDLEKYYMGARTIEGITAEDIIEIKEHVLKYNLGSFIYDW